jgi:hypothetical protein
MHMMEETRPRTKIKMKTELDALGDADYPDD